MGLLVLGSSCDRAPTQAFEAQERRWTNRYACQSARPHRRNVTDGLLQARGGTILPLVLLRPADSLRRGAALFLREVRHRRNDPEALACLDVVAGQIAAQVKDSERPRVGPPRTNVEPLARRQGWRVFHHEEIFFCRLDHSLAGCARARGLRRPSPAVSGRGDGGGMAMHDAMRSVTVVGQGEATGKPDIARTSLGVEATAATVEDAMNQTTVADDGDPGLAEEARHCGEGHADGELLDSDRAAVPPGALAGRPARRARARAAEGRKRGRRRASARAPAGAAAAEREVPGFELGRGRDSRRLEGEPGAPGRRGRGGEQRAGA